MSGLGATPWVDESYKRALPELQSQVPPEWLPQPLDLEQRQGQGIRRRYSVEEYGCGYFGCVSPTDTPNLVVKITTDESEAWFAHVAMQLAQQDGWPVGMIAYHKVLKLDGRKHRNRPVYLLWRDEAWDVGYLKGELTWGAAPRDPTATLAANLGQWDNWSTLLQARILKSSDPLALVTEAQQYDERAWQYISEHFDTRGDAIALRANASLTSRQPAWDVARAVRACGVISEWMDNTYGSQEIGSALSYYLEQGLIPADLHLGNIGKAFHPEVQELVPTIVDPGVTLPVQPHWYDVTIPEELSIAA